MKLQGGSYLVGKGSGEGTGSKGWKILEDAFVLPPDTPWRI